MALPETVCFIAEAVDEEGVLVCLYCRRSQQRLRDRLFDGWHAEWTCRIHDPRD